MYDDCDLQWVSMTASGLLSLTAGIAVFLFPRLAMGLIVTFAAVVLLVLAGILIAEGLFIGGRGASGWIIVVIGIVGIILAAVTAIYPEWIIITAGELIGISLIIFGCVMVFAAATIIYDFLWRPVMAFASFFAILLGIYFVFFPENSLAIFTVIAGIALFFYGIFRILSGIRLRDWQKTCPREYGIR